MHPRLDGPFAAISKLQNVPAMTLECAMEIMGAERGNVQLASWGQRAALTISAHSGLGEEFLSAFRSVYLRDSCACGRALLTRTPVSVEDVLDDPAFGPSRSVVLDAGIRAILSVPLISTSGALVGMVSTHRGSAGLPSDDQLRAMEVMARSAANAIVAFRAEARFAARDR